MVAHPQRSVGQRPAETVRLANPSPDIRKLFPVISVATRKRLTGTGRKHAFIRTA
jgi:hypothetical protein